MEIGADFSHDEGKDDLLALRAALDNYHRADEPWVGEALRPPSLPPQDHPQR